MHAPSTSQPPPCASSQQLMKLTAPGWLISLVLHVSLLIMLALVCFQQSLPLVRSITALPAKEEPLEDAALAPETPLDLDREEQDAQSLADFSQSSAELPEANLEELSAEVEVATSGLAIAEDTFLSPADAVKMSLSLNKPYTNLFASRSPSERRKQLAASCGSPASEEAVAKALRWLADHQRADGSWDFDHRTGPCKSNPGSLADARNGATALALAPFLGAGNTHRSGDYKATVAAGLAYLTRHMKLRDTLGDLSDAGQLYSHGIATLVLCEAYGMTQDKKLEAPAQAALNFVVHAQDPTGGGWRYQPRQAGDTSVLGWQLMALKSGHMAYLHVPPPSVLGASKFLDTVQSDSGAAYGYTTPGDAPGTTSVGLLCRMYLGWKKDHGALQRGVARLGELGPSKSNLYYNYYATQVMRHHGGDSWKKWNQALRDQVVATQAQNGAERGSWYIPGDHGSERGGRIYCTALSTMILEVYYRHLPIYGDHSVDDDFPLRD